MRPRLVALIASLLFLSPNIALRGTASPESSTTQKSFASFAYFIHKLKLPVKTIGYVFANPQSIYEGPFHTNDELHIYLPPHYFEEEHLPFFRGPVTTAAQSIAYYNENGPLNTQGTINESRFRTIFRDEVKTGVPVIPLPEKPEKLVEDNALLGYKIPKSTNEFVFLPHDANNQLTAGVFVNGTIDGLTFDTAPEKNAVIIFRKGKIITTIEINFQDNVTLFAGVDKTTKKFQGIPNGAVFIHGNLGSLESFESGVQGKVRGHWTVGSSGDLFIPGNLLYSDTPAGSQPTGGDVLALIAQHVFIPKKAPELFFLYATLFVKTFLVLPNFDSPHQGHLIWWGNYIGEYPAIMGRFDRATGLSTDGYDLHKFYDARLAHDPPPFFPTFNEI